MQTDNHDRACIVCRHVWQQERPCLLISCASGDLQVICGFDDHDFDGPNFIGSTKDALAVHLGHLIERDPAISKILDLPRDWSAKRKTTNHSWEEYHDPD